MKLLIALLALLIAAPVQAQGDPRLQTLPFTPGTVYTLRIAPGYVATVILSPEERIESVAVGNSAAWDVTPSKSGDHLFVRPLAAGVPTNVQVVTDSRHYSFVLQTTVEGDPQALFQLRFDYEQPDYSMPSLGPGGAIGAGDPGAVAAVADYAPAEYRMSGDRLARPLSITDDGERTVFTFAETAALPAIYAVDEHKRESLVTMRQGDEGWVVDRVWPRYVFRLGKEKAKARRIEGARRP